MSFLDDAKKQAKGLADKAEKLAADHKVQIKDGIDKAEGLADKATKGKYSSKIAGAGDKAAAAVDKLKDDQGPVA